MNFERIFLFIIRWGTYLILLTPLVIVGKFFFLFVGPKALYFCALTEIIFTAWLFLALFYPEYRPKLNPILLSLALFLFFSILSAVFGASPSKSFWSTYERMGGLLIWLHLSAFFLAVSTTFKRKDWLKIFGISIGAAMLVGLLSLLPKIGLPDVLGAFPTQEGATLGNTSFLATYLLLNCFLAFYLLFASVGRLKTLAGMGFVLIVLALLASTGYAAIFSFFIGLLLIPLLWFVFCRGPFLQLLGISLLGILLLAGLVSLFLVFQSDNFLHQAIVKHFYKARLIVWQVSARAWLERPFLGWGPENFDFGFYKYFNPSLFAPAASPNAQVWYDRAHNIILDNLVAGGIFGLLSYLGVVAGAFYVLWKNYFKRNFSFWTAGILGAGLTAYFLQNLTVFDMISSYLMFFLILGFIGSIQLPESCYCFVLFWKKLRKLIGKLTGKPSRLITGTASRLITPRLRRLAAIARPTGLFFKTRRKALACFLISALFVFSLFEFVIQPLRADYYAMAGFNAGSSERRLILYKKTLALSSLGKYQVREFFADELLAERPGAHLKPELDFAVGELKKNIDEAPLNFRSYLKLGQLYNFYGGLDYSKFSEAEIVLEKAVEMSPGHQYGYWALAETELALGNKRRAESLLEKAIQLEPSFEGARSKARQLLGN